MCSIHFPNFDSLFIRKFCSRVFLSFPLALRSITMLNTVKNILPVSSIIKIAQKTSSSYPIFVATLMAWRGWTNKGQQYQFMDFSSNFPTQCNLWITILTHTSAKNLLWSINYGPITRLFAARNNSPIRPNFSIIADFIARITGNWLENFVRRSKMEISHGVALLGRVASGLEPCRC